MKLFFCALGVVIPLLTLAAAAPATIITRPGVATPPIKYYFDLSSALSEGVNQGVRVIVSASNAEKTAVRFDSVQLFDQSGATVGTNVASKTDALTVNPYGFTFSNFGVAPADLANVAGVQITFMDLGGENSTGKVTIQSVAVSVTRDSGEACVIADPITIVLPPPPPPTIVSIQRARPLVQPGTHGTGGSGGSPTSQGPYGSSDLSTSGVGGGAWSSPTSAGVSDNAYAFHQSSGSGVTQELQARGFGFTVPASATINGVVFQVEMKASVLNPFSLSVHDNTARIVKAGSQVGTDYARASGVLWPESDTVITYGGSSDLWGTTWTGNEISAATFGFDIGAFVATNNTAHIDYISATVYYTPAGASVYDSFIDLLRVIFRFKK